MGILDSLKNSGVIATPKVVTSANGDKIIKPSVTLFEWETPERVFKKKDKEFHRKIAVIIIFFAMMLLIIKEFILIVVLGIVFAVIYAFTSIPPAIVKHKVTTNGVEYASQVLYTWDTLKNFFIDHDESGTDILVINTREALPGRLLLLLIPEIDKSELTSKLNEYISIEENPEKNIYNDFMRRLGNRLNI